MKHITFSNKSLLMGDEAADALVEYSALLAKLGSADTVTLRAFGSDASEVDATFVLAQSPILMAETAHTSMNEPDNTEAVQEIKRKIMQLESPRTVTPHEDTSPEAYGDQGLD